MNWTYRLQNESPDSVTVEIRDGRAVKHSFVEKRYGTLHFGKRESVEDMFLRAHSKAKEYIREAEEAKQLSIEGNQNGETYFSP